MSNSEWARYLSPGDMLWGPHPRHEYIPYRVVDKSETSYQLAPLLDMLAHLDSAYDAPVSQSGASNNKSGLASPTAGLRGRSTGGVVLSHFYAQTPDTQTGLSPDHPITPYTITAPFDEVAEFCVLIDGQLRASDGSVANQKQTTKLRSLPDMVLLNTLSPATVLHNVRARFFDKAIYTRVSSILISVNPYRDLSLYTEDVLNQYRYKLPHGGSQTKASSTTPEAPLVHLPVPPVVKDKNDDSSSPDGNEEGHMDDTVGDVVAREDGLPPHLFALCRDAYAGVVAEHRSQSVLISGESGAGKSEATKLVLRYVCTVSNSGDGIRSKLTSASPLLEAFGNAKTVMNDNSSRFGKWIQIDVHVANRPGAAIPSTNLPGQVIGGCIVQYLLEESRVVMHAYSERNYHVFYGLLRPASLKHLIALEKVTQPSTLPESLVDDEEMEKSIKSMQTLSAFSHLSAIDFAYLNPHKVTAAEEDPESFLPTKRGVRLQSAEIAAQTADDDDTRNFLELLEAMKALDFTVQEQRSVADALLGILHLGNVKFFENAHSYAGLVTSDEEDSEPGAGARGSRSGSALRAICALFGVDMTVLKRCLTERNMASARGSVLTIRFSHEQAADARDSLAKNLYSKLFDWIVYRINVSMKQSKECENSIASLTRSINFLDIYGFEVFEKNSLEQLFINYANEKLQQHFVRRVFKMELEIYERNGLSLKNIPFFDNQACLDLIEYVPQRGKIGVKAPVIPAGVLAMLNEEINVPRGSDLTLFEKVSRQFQGNHDHFSVPLTSGSDALNFVIHHYAAPVTYCMDGFLAKNRRRVSDDLISIMKTCGNSLVRQLYDENILKEQEKQQAVTIEGDDAKQEMEEKKASEEKAEEAKKPEPEKPKVSGLAARFLSAAAQNTPEPELKPVAVASAKKMDSLCIQFRNQLNRLVESIEQTDTHFVRCIKPNLCKKAGVFDSPMVLRQLRTSGVMDAIRVRQVAYPNRSTIPDFLRRFSQVVIHGLQQSTPLMVPQGVTTIPQGISVGDAFRKIKDRLRTNPSAVAAGKTGAAALAHQLSADEAVLARAIALHMLQTLCPVDDPELLQLQRKLGQPQGSSNRATEKKTGDEDSLEIWQVGSTHAFWRPITETRLQAAAEKTLAQAALKIQARFRAYRIRRVYVKLAAARSDLQKNLEALSKIVPTETSQLWEKELSQVVSESAVSEINRLTRAMVKLSEAVGCPGLDRAVLSAPMLQKRIVCVQSLHANYSQIVGSSRLLFGKAFTAEMHANDSLLTKGFALASEVELEIEDQVALLKALVPAVEAIESNSAFAVAAWLKTCSEAVSLALCSPKVSLAVNENAKTLSEVQQKRDSLGLRYQIPFKRTEGSPLVQKSTLDNHVSTANLVVEDIISLWKLVKEVAQFSESLLPNLAKSPSVVSDADLSLIKSKLLGRNESSGVLNLTISSVKREFVQTKELADRISSASIDLGNILNMLAPGNKAPVLNKIFPKLAEVSQVVDTIRSYHSIADQTFGESQNESEDDSKGISTSTLKQLVDTAVSTECISVPPGMNALKCRVEIAYARGTLARERAGAVIDAAVTSSTASALPVLKALKRGAAGIADATASVSGLKEAANLLKLKVGQLSSSAATTANSVSSGATEEEKQVAEDMAVLAQLEGAIKAPTTDDALLFANWIDSSLEPAVNAHISYLQTTTQSYAVKSHDELLEQAKLQLSKLNAAFEKYQTAGTPNSVTPHEFAAIFVSLAKHIEGKTSSLGSAVSALSAATKWLNEGEPAALSSVSVNSANVFGPDASPASDTRNEAFARGKTLALALKQAVALGLDQSAAVAESPSLLSSSLMKFADRFEAAMATRDELINLIRKTKCPLSDSASTQEAMSFDRLALSTELTSLLALGSKLQNARKRSAWTILAIQEVLNRVFSSRLAMADLSSTWTASAPFESSSIQADEASALKLQVSDLERKAESICIGTEVSAFDIDGDVSLALKLCRVHQTHIKLINSTLEYINVLKTQTVVLKPGSAPVSLGDGLNQLGVVTAQSDSSSWLSHDDAYDVYVAGLPGFYIRPDASNFSRSKCAIGDIAKTNDDSAASVKLNEGTLRGIYTPLSSIVSAITSKFPTVKSGAPSDQNAINNLISSVSADTSLCMQLYEREVVVAAAVSASELGVSPGSEKGLIQSEMKVHEGIAVAAALSDVDLSVACALELDDSATAYDSESKGDTMGTSSRRLVPAATANAWAARYQKRGSSSLCQLMDNTGSQLHNGQQAGDLEARWARSIMLGEGAGITLAQTLLSRVASARIKAKLTRESILRKAVGEVAKELLSAQGAKAAEPAASPTESSAGSLSAFAALKATLALRKQQNAPSQPAETQPSAASVTPTAPSVDAQPSTSTPALRPGVTALRISRNRNAVSNNDAQAAAAAAASVPATNADAAATNGVTREQLEKRVDSIEVEAARIRALLASAQGGPKQ